MKIDRDNKNIDYSNDTLFYSSRCDALDIEEIVTDWRAKQKFKDMFIEDMLFSSLNFSIDIEQDRLWLDNTKIVTRIVKNDNSIDIIDGYIEDGNFKGLKVYTLLNTTKAFEEEIQKIKNKNSKEHLFGRRLLELE